MNNDNLALDAWSYGLAGFAYSAFTLHLVRIGYLRAPRNASAVALLLAVVCSAAWALLNLTALFYPSRTLVMLGTVADSIRYGGWYAFLLMLFRPRKGEKLPAGVAWMIPTAALLVLVQVFAASGVYVPEGALRVQRFSSMAMSLLALMLVEQLFRNVPEDSRWNAKPLCLGLAGTFLFDTYLYSFTVLFNRMDVDAGSVHGAVHALMVPFLLLSTARRQDWIAQLRVSRKAAFHSATLLIAGLYLLFISSVGYYVRFFGGDWGRALQQMLMFSALIALMVLVLSGTVRAKLRVFLGKHFFRYRYDYRDEWLKFTQTLSAQHSPQTMGQQVIRGLADMLESPAGGLWTKAPNRSSFVQAARWNLAESVGIEDEKSQFTRFLIETGWVINLEEYSLAPQRYSGLSLPLWLQEIPRAWLIVPLRVDDELTGFVVLASPRTKTDVNWEVNDLLKTAGRQAASFLAQMQATEALLEVRKFDAFNRMSAFVVHDLKNIVTQLSLMMKNAKRLQANPEFQQDMLLTVENSLDRMRQLMLQLREGASPPGTSFGVDLGVVLHRIATAAASRERHVDLKEAGRVFTRGQDERLERIIGHIVQNALDATEEAGQVWLQSDRYGSKARIVVRDTGQGMSKEFVRDRLFKPFQTTKPAGMGIGAYESFQYVQELGGTIDVQSEPNEGTVVTLLLPLFEDQNEFNSRMLKTS